MADDASLWFWCMNEWNVGAFTFVALICILIGAGMNEAPLLLVCSSSSSTSTTLARSFADLLYIIFKKFSLYFFLVPVGTAVVSLRGQLYCLRQVKESFVLTLAYSHLNEVGSRGWTRWYRRAVLTCWTRPTEIRTFNKCKQFITDH